MKPLYIILLILLKLNANPKPIWINIYIHGTITPHLSLSDFFKVLNQTQKNSVYAEITRIIRSDPFFHQAQPIQELNLKKAFPTKSLKGHGANIFAEFYDKISKKISENTPPIHHYTFGWSGLLTIAARRKAAQKLYEQLARKIKKIEMQNYEPKIRIIGYSHGGTIALYLAHEAHKNRPLSFMIDELILISAPIQPETQKYINSPFFKKIFNFYSNGDRVQASDFLSSITHSFSHKTFLNSFNFKVPDNVTQTQIRFLRKHLIIKTNDGSVKKVPRYDYVNPGHTEMFFFGWAAQWYRKHFPINPLPTALILPKLINEIQKNNLESKHLCATIIPEDEVIIFKNKKNEEKINAPFFPKNELYALQKELVEFRPQNYKIRYKIRVKEAKKNAKKTFQEKLRRKNLQKKLLRSYQEEILKQLTAATMPTNQPLKVVAPAIQVF
ncbi:TPA: hypothetical protein DIC20_00475 [Candidatus Dependentiae bacterium]|nr:MAG: hypothetical protein US03_C0002G0055 [candidate division TM6 bacterium GW2011_GWF2_36_131]KKQ03489.1 MAG: hypothetical protein US13_C0002G0055 [candidate division TM6 bacterium GW2011_GWE2_36_25]KKQ20237.1 MAG: hypothetical protein US32_C0001G0134 [candidate division TM6 bacterium GW2011_GWA2_36_9]HBR70776.1 hypothetical protein [Candidatus Dependentiae bacterium]HCU00161.1 hypothetical protein [Candidatus Dependentiae bacterium]